jgi:hypothetical protein
MEAPGLKYIFVYGAREPISENTRKAYDVEKKRIERCENWGDDMIFPIHHYVTQYKAFFIVDTDDEIKVAKWVEDYSPYLDIEVSPIIERAAYEKAKKKA